MCLSIPAKVEKIDGERAQVSFSGNTYRANISMIGDLEKGDYVLLHAGFAIQKISERDAQDTLKLIIEMGNVSNR